MIHTRTAVVLLGALALAATACGGPGDAGATGGTLADGKTFTLGLASDPGNLDPHMSVLSVTGQVDRFLYDSLLELTPDGKPLPALAEKWDTTTATAKFTLRPGITCADGTGSA